MARILIIDDERLIRHALRDILEYEQHVIEEAEDGNAGLKACWQESLMLRFAMSKCQERTALRW